MNAAIEFLLAAGLASGTDPDVSSDDIPGACTFEGLSQADKRRYRSRYRRRVRVDGQAFADRWIHEQVCMTAEERKQARGKDGKPCRKTRTEMRVTPGYDGAMSMIPMVVCAD